MKDISQMEIPSKCKIKRKVIIEPDMFYSKAFNILPSSGLKTLMRCLQKRKWQKVRRGIIYTDDGFTFPYAEAEALRIAKNTQHWKNLRKLVEIGFLEVVHQGGWYQKHEREKDYSVYKYSERWRKYGTPEFERVEKPKSLPDSFHIRKNIEKKKLKSTSQKRRCQLHKSVDDRQKSTNERLHESKGEKQDIKSRQSFAFTA